MSGRRDEPAASSPPAVPPVPPVGDLFERVLVDAFPFHLQVDAEGRATRVGASLELVCPDLRPGSSVHELLRISSPPGATWQRGTGADVPAGLVIVHAATGALVLRGQLLPAGDGVLFLGSPWVTNLAALTALGLRLNDFAAADPVADFMMLLGAQASALADTERLAARLEGSLADLAHRDNHDALTGLANRDRFVLGLADAMSQAQDSGGSLCVLLLDLDRFQEINDSLGQDVGDRLLQHVGPRIVGALAGAGQVVARFSGDEFAVLLTSAQQGEAALMTYHGIARRVLDAIEEPFVVEGVNLVMEASAGLAMAPEDGSAGAPLLRHADAAMHRAKSDQEGLAVYCPGLDGHDPRRLRLLAELRTAVDQGQLMLCYQPLVTMATGAVGGVEALLRWQHPQEGLLSPAEFIPLAERSGFIHRLTLAVLTMACEQARTWQLAGRPLVVAVNVSARNVLDAAFPDTVLAALSRVGLPPHLLRLEVTESAIIADPVRARTVLGRLDAMGVAMSIDDFGTGYTSLAHLRDLPVHELKIDRSFVTTMLTDPRNLVIVRTVVELAGRLGLDSVAEGIEDAGTMAALRELGCTTAQGFHLARPMPAEVLGHWVDAWVAAHPQHTSPPQQPALQTTSGGSWQAMPPVPS